MDAVTHPDPQVEAYVAVHFVPAKLELGRPDRRDQVHQLGPLWTPTHYVLTHRRRELRRDVGYLAPPDYLATLALGAGLGLAATGRLAEGARVLERAMADLPASPFVPELLYWRGALGYLTPGGHAALLPWWDRLRAEFPDSAWARRCVTE
jgi:hypothetical protein